MLLQAALKSRRRPKDYRKRIAEPLREVGNLIDARMFNQVGKPFAEFTRKLADWLCGVDWLKGHETERPRRFAPRPSKNW